MWLKLITMWQKLLILWVYIVKLFILITIHLQFKACRCDQNRVEAWSTDEGGEQVCRSANLATKFVWIMDSVHNFHEFADSSNAVDYGFLQVFLDWISDFIILFTLWQRVFVNQPI